jgi:hypothetical protein
MWSYAWSIVKSLVEDLTHKNYWLYLGLWLFMIDWSVRFTLINALDRTVNH